MIRLTYRIETPGDVESMAAKIASDQSTGTFVAVPGETPELKARVAARVVVQRIVRGQWREGHSAAPSVANWPGTRRPRSASSEVTSSGVGMASAQERREATIAPAAFA